MHPVDYQDAIKLWGPEAATFLKAWRLAREVRASFMHIEDRPDDQEEFHRWQGADAVAQALWSEFRKAAKVPA